MEDITLAAREAGTGEPLILLHGNGESGAYFSAQMDYFSSRYHVLAVDTRGHGQSPRGSAPFTFGQFAEDLADFLDERGIAQTYLLGFSDGASTAMEFALRYPARVRRLVLNGANLNPRGVKPSVQIPIVLGYGLVSLIACFDPKARPKKEILGLMVTQPHITPAQLTTLTMPTLVLVGTRDMIRDRHSRQIAAAIPDARLVRIKGTHFIAAEASGEFNKIVNDFLEETI